MNTPKASRTANMLPDSVDTEDESAKFFTKALYVTYCMILHDRKLIPEVAFKKRTLLPNIIRTYVMNSENPIGVRLAFKFSGLGDAIRKQYLDEFALVVRDENCADEDNALEAFSWRMCYKEPNMSATFTNANGDVIASLQYQGRDHEKEQIRTLLVTIRKICRENLKPLPADVDCGLRISYTNIVPDKYQCKGFYEADNTYVMDPRAKTKYAEGTLVTPYHACINIHSMYFKDAEPDHQAGDQAGLHESFVQNVSDDAPENLDAMNINEPFEPMEEARSFVNQNITMESIRSSNTSAGTINSGGLNETRQTSRLSNENTLTNESAIAHMSSSDEDVATTRPKDAPKRKLTAKVSSCVKVTPGHTQ